MSTSYEFEGCKGVDFVGLQCYDRNQYNARTFYAATEQLVTVDSTLSTALPYFATPPTYLNPNAAILLVDDPYFIALAGPLLWSQAHPYGNGISPGGIDPSTGLPFPPSGMKQTNVAAWEDNIIDRPAYTGLTHIWTGGPLNDVTKFSNLGSSGGPPSSFTLNMRAVFSLGVSVEDFMYSFWLFSNFYTTGDNWQSDIIVRRVRFQVSQPRSYWIGQVNIYRAVDGDGNPTGNFILDTATFVLKRRGYAASVVWNDIPLYFPELGESAYNSLATPGLIGQAIFAIYDETTTAWQTRTGWTLTGA